MARIITTIDKTGPFFTKDPALTFRANVDVLLAAIAAEAEEDVRAQSEPFRDTGAFVAGVRGRTHRLDGAAFKTPTATVSQTHVYPWKNAGPRQYRGGKLEASRHMFRRTRSRIRGVNKLNSAELLKGLQ